MRFLRDICSDLRYSVEVKSRSGVGTLTSHASAPRVSANRPKVYDRLTPDAVLDALRRMHRIRRFEEAAEESYIRGLSYGTMHLSIGQEATAVGVCMPLGDADCITSTHRGHGHCIAKGAELTPMFAEFLGREGGYCKGRGGSMHIADPAKGNLGANGIVGGGLPIAVGAALSAKKRRTGAVALAFFGDGANNEGAFHEALNIASIWKLPVVFVCENNQYAMSMAMVARDRRRQCRRPRGRLCEFPASSSTATISPPWPRPRSRRRSGRGRAKVRR